MNVRSNTSPLNGSDILRFEPFEFDMATGELCRHGARVRLQGQPIQLLKLLLDRPGAVATREEMRAQLWPEDTFVDFEHSLNSAIKKLRQALGDSATNPRFVETLARQGYRFIAPVHNLNTVEVIHAAPQEVAAGAPKRRLTGWVAAAVIILMAILAGVAYKFWPEVRPQPPSGLTLLMGGDGNISNPSISPDGKMLAYVKADGGEEHVYIRRLAGGRSINLSGANDRDEEPAFSPDDERIAFTRFLPGTNQPEICIVPVLGGEDETAVQDARDPAWSSDGTRLAFILVRPNGAEALATAAVNGSGMRIVLEGDSTYPFLSHPSWSADGRRIAVERSMGGISSEIWLVPAQGGSPSRLETMPSRVSAHHPVFTQDGRGIIFSSNAPGARNILYYSLASGSSRQLTRGSGPDEWPSISRTGRVAFLSPTSKDVLFTQRLNSTAATALLSHSPFLWAPFFSPDGLDVVYSQGEYDGSWRIYTASLAGGGAHLVTSGREPQIYGRFSSDGKWIIYFTWTPGACRIWRVPRDGGAAQPLTPAGENDAYGDLSPDGRMLAFARVENGASHVFVKAVDGGAERRIVDSPSTLPRWSPDGKWIAYSSDQSLEGGIFIVKPNADGARQLSKTGGWPVWLPKGKRIAFRTPRADGTQQIEAVSLEGGPTAPLGNYEFSGSNDPIDFSTDGKSIVFTNGVTFSSEIWLLTPRRQNK